MISVNLINEIAKQIFSNEFIISFGLLGEKFLEKCNKIPDNVDVLITHSLPIGDMIVSSAGWQK